MPSWSPQAASRAAAELLQNAQMPTTDIKMAALANPQARSLVIQALRNAGADSPEADSKALANVEQLLLNCELQIRPPLTTWPLKLWNYPSGPSKPGYGFSNLGFSKATWPSITVVQANLQ